MTSCYDQLTPVKSSYLLTSVTRSKRGLKFIAHRRREGSTLLAQPCDCADDDLSHYDVTSEPSGEVLIAAKI